MLRFFFGRNNKQINCPSVQISHFFSTKDSGNKDKSKAKNIKLEFDSPRNKILKSLKRDAALMKNYLRFWEKNKEFGKYNEEKINWDKPDGPIFTTQCDLVIIGGGAMGSAIAYWIKKMFHSSFHVVVVEKDPTYKEASTVLSVGGLRQQFSLEENIAMSLFGAEFIRNANDYLGIAGEPFVDLQFQPHGYLSLATPEKAHILHRNSKLQNAMGANNVLLSASQLKKKFPWLNTDGIELGCLGLEKEGWFDPWSLLSALKRKAISMGVEYVTAEVVGFNIEKSNKATIPSVPMGEYDQIEYLIVKTKDEKLRPIHFSKCVIAAGAFSQKIAEMANIGLGDNMLATPLPVEPRKRYVYCFHAPDGPGLNTPMTIDTSGVYFRREGLANHFICGRCPEEHEEPCIDNLEVDPEFFNEKVWPHLANRVKAFENLKVKSSWAGYYEYNTHDKNGIIGFHPYHQSLLFATGFSGHGIQQAPAVGRAVAELIRYNGFQTIDLTKLSFQRFLTLEEAKEMNIW